MKWPLQSARLSFLDFRSIVLGIFLIKLSTSFPIYLMTSVETENRTLSMNLNRFLDTQIWQGFISDKDFGKYYAFKWSPPILYQLLDHCICEFYLCPNFWPLNFKRGVKLNEILWSLENCHLFRRSKCEKFKCKKVGLRSVFRLWWHIWSLHFWVKTSKVWN